MRKYKVTLSISLAFVAASAIIIGSNVDNRHGSEAELSAPYQQPKLLGNVDTHSERPVPSIPVKPVPPIPDVPDMNIPERISETYIQTNTNSAFPTFSSRLLDINSRRPQYFSDYENLLSAINVRSIWEPTNELDSAQDLLDKLSIKDPELLRFNSLKLESLVVGDVVDIPIKQLGTTYQMHVKSVRSDSENDVTWRGYILDNEQEYYVSFTRNKLGLTIGGVTTPQGHFTLEAHEDVGWISVSQTSFHNAAATDVVYPTTTEAGQDNE